MRKLAILILLFIGAVAYCQTEINISGMPVATNPDDNDVLIINEDGNTRQITRSLLQKQQADSLEWMADTIYEHLQFLLWLSDTVYEHNLRLIAVESAGGGGTYYAGNGINIDGSNYIELADLTENTTIDFSTYFFRLRNLGGYSIFYIDADSTHIGSEDAYLVLNELDEAKIGSENTEMIFDNNNIYLNGVPTDNTETYVLARDNATGEVSQRTVSSIAVGGDTIDMRTVMMVNEKIRPIFVFGSVGSANFSTNAVYYGSWYNPGPDTFVITGTHSLMGGTTPSMTFNLETHTDFNSGSATTVWTSANSISSTTSGDIDVSPNNPYILPGKQIWAITPSVSTAPDYWALTMYGYLLNRSTDTE